MTEIEHMKTPALHAGGVFLARAKQDIKQFLLKIKLLEGKEIELKNGIAKLTEHQWNLLQCEINSIKRDMENTFAKYDSKYVKEHLKRRILKRRQKRLKIHRRKSEKKLVRRNMTKQRQQLHMAIDRNLAQEKQKDVEAQQARDAAEYAKWVLSNVTKKKADAQQYICLLNSLKDLRKARRTAAHTSSADNSSEFVSKINALLAVWADAIEEYENEESNLKTILTDKHKTVEEQWSEILFGIVDKASISELSCDEPNLCNLIEIRRGWDSCLVPQDFVYGSRIPAGWVLPPKNPLHSWKEYRK